MDSFLYPAVQELLKLSVGVRAYDVIEKEIFILRAYLLTIFGDIPAVSMLLQMKGHNTHSPCYLCMIQGVRIPNSTVMTHYVPLCRKNLQSGHSDYDPTNLPPRTHRQFMVQANEVQSAETDAKSERLAMEYSINGVPLLGVLDSLVLPLSAGYEFMHLVFENLIPNLALLWSGNFKNLGKNQPFKLRGCSSQHRNGPINLFCRSLVTVGTICWTCCTQWSVSEQEVLQPLL
jgi:hypothetical protein